MSTRKAQINVFIRKKAMSRRAISENRINRIVNRAINEVIYKEKIDENFRDWIRDHGSAIKKGAIGLAAAAAMGSCTPNTWRDDYVEQYDLLRGDIESVEREYGKPIGEIPPSEYDWIYDKWGDFMDENDLDVTDIQTTPYAFEGTVRRIVKDTIRRILR